MLSAIIEVAYVYSPKPGKKMGSVKTIDDQFYSVYPDDLSRFTPGGTYTVQYEEREYQGNLYRTIKFPKGASAKQAPVKQQQLPLANGASTKSVEMFVMGTIGRYLQGCGSGFPGAEELTDMVRSAKEAFERGMRNEPEVRSYSDLNDPIPFE